MNARFVLRWILSSLFLLALFTGCAPQPSPAPVETRPPDTETPPPTSTPTPFIPSLEGTPLPVLNIVISPENAGEIIQLAQWGKGTLNQVAFSPDGKWFAAATALGIYLYPADTPAEARFIETDGWATSLAFSPDGTIIAAGTWHSTVQLWQTADGIPLGTLEGHIDVVTSVAISTDGSLLASGSDDGTVRLWNLADGRLWRVIEAEAEVISVAFSPDGTLLAAGLADSTVKVW